MLLPTTPGRRHFHHPTLRKLKKEKSVQVTQVPVIDGVPESRILEDGNGGDGEVTMKVPREYVPYPHPLSARPVDISKLLSLPSRGINSTHM